MGYAPVIFVTLGGLLVGGPLFLFFWGRDQWRLRRDARATRRPK